MANYSCKNFPVWPTV